MICLRNGEWEPDPRVAECTRDSELETTGTTILSTYNNVSHKI